MSANYGDGFESPTLSVTGEELPSARLVSLIVFGDEDVPDPQFTLANMQWGQIITHDMSLLAGSTQSSRKSSFLTLKPHFKTIFFLYISKTSNTLLHRRR